MSNTLNQWHGRTALIVDDSVSMRLEAQRILQDIGFGKILLAENGLQAMELLASNTVDFLLTDLNMPVMDGVELLTEVEKHNAYRLYVGVMSGLDASLLNSVREIAKNSEFEMIGVLAKPIGIDIMQEILAPHDPERHRPASERRDSEQCSEEEFAAAIANNEVTAFFQPKIQLCDGKVVGIEALARWKHPLRGLVMPAVFMEFLEAGPLAKKHFLYQCAYILKVLPEIDSISPDVKINVNMPVSLLVTPNLVEELMQLFAGQNTDPQRIIFEVTETSVMSNLKTSLTTLARLRMKGFGISMDDYGTGYSSMKQLAQCPFTELKIDQSFVHNSASNQKMLPILNAALGICKHLKLTSVAEGIENEADFQLLRELGCNIGQGYFFSRPLPIDQMLVYLTTHRA